MPKTTAPSEEELSTMLPWEFEERDGWLYLVPEGGKWIDLGPTEQACEKMAGWLTARDFGGA